MQQQIVNRSVLFLVLLVISILFYQVLKPFVQAIFVAALFSALFHPLYRRLQRTFGGRNSLASITTLLIVLFFIVTPLSIIFSIVLSQAAELGDRMVPMIQQRVSTPGAISDTLSKLPFYDTLQPYRSMVLNMVGDMSKSISGWAVDAAQSFTRGAISGLFTLLIILYTMYFLLIDGDKFLYYLLVYLPLNDEEETKLLERFISVTRATLKGTAVIGILQGGLAGLALGLGGIPSALFWAVAMMFLSVVPGIGGALVWLPATIYLFLTGKIITSIVVGLFCAVVVGAIDNLLRPKLVGNDTQLHELMIFFSTLGGLLMFGFMGFVIGPIVAALFVTVWELYGYEFSRWLPSTEFRPHSGDVELPHENMSKVDNNKSDNVASKNDSSDSESDDDTGPKIT